MTETNESEKIQRRKGRIYGNLMGKLWELSTNLHIALYSEKGLGFEFWDVQTTELFKQGKKIYDKAKTIAVESDTSFYASMEIFNSYHSQLCERFAYNINDIVFKNK